MGGAELCSGQLTALESGAELSAGEVNPIESGAELTSSNSLTLESGAELTSGQVSTYMDVFFHNPPGSPGWRGEDWVAGQGAATENWCSNGLTQMASGLYVPVLMIKRRQPTMKFFAHGLGAGEFTRYVRFFSITRRLNAPLQWDVILFDKDRKFAPHGGEHTTTVDTTGVSPGVGETPGAVLTYFVIEIHMPSGEIWRSPRLIQNDYDWTGEARKSAAVHLSGTCMSELLGRNQQWFAPDLNRGSMLIDGIKDTLARGGITNTDIRIPDSIIPVQYHRVGTSPQAVFEDMIFVQGGCWHMEDDRMVVEKTALVPNSEYYLNSCVHLRALRLAKSTREIKTKHYVDVAIESGGFSKDLTCRGTKCVGIQTHALDVDLITAQPQVLEVEQGEIHTYSYLRQNENAPEGFTALSVTPPPGGQFNGAGTGPANTIRFQYQPAFSMQLGLGGGGIPPSSLTPAYRVRVKGRIWEETPTIPFNADLRAQSIDQEFSQPQAFGIIEARVWHQLLSSQAMSQNLCDILTAVSCRRTMPGNWTIYPANPWIRPNTWVHLKDYLSNTDLDHYVEACTIAGSPRQTIAMNLETTTRIPLS